MSLFDMIPRPVRIGLMGAVIASAGVAGWMWRGVIAERDTATIEKHIAQQREQAATDARATERKQQEKVNEALIQQNAALAGVADKLHLELGRLRNRPERPAVVPAAPRSACEGATGAALSRPDGEFLAREAARADEIRTGLVACYQVIDGLR